MPFYAGLDWGGESHAVCIVNGTGRIVGRLDVRHDASGLSDMVVRLQRIAPPAELPIAIERPSGLIVDARLAAGHPVVPIHPNVVKACRPRYRAAGGKSDPGDAYMLADILRTDGHRLRALMAVSDEIKALRALVRGRNDLVAQRVAFGNQLRSLLEGFWPGAAAIFANVDSPIALAFVERYPTPESASRLGQRRLAGFLALHRTADADRPRSCWSASEPPPADAPAKPRAKPRVNSCAPWPARSNPRWRDRQDDFAHRAPRLRTARRQDRHVLPRAGRLYAAQILAELGDVRERFQTCDQLFAEAGLARSPTPPARPAASAGDGPATSACAPPSPAWPTTPDTSPWAAEVYKSPTARLRSPPRHPYPRQSLGAGPLARLAGWQAYDPSAHRGALRLA